MGKTVSVIVPVYRTEKWLARCVDSILEQTCGQLEIILVDDKSPDRCPALCDAFAKRDSRVRVLHKKKNGGLMAAWMDGVKISTGDYLMFVDSDDWIEACMVKELLSFSTDCGREVICGNYVQDWENGQGNTVRSVRVLQTLSPGIYEGDALREKVHPFLVGRERRPVTLSRCMKLFSRRLILENMHYCNPAVRMGEDTNITIPALLDAERIVILDGAYYYHYLYLEQSMVHRYDPGLSDNIRLISGIIRQILEDKGVINEKEQGGREYLLLLFLVIKNEARGGKKGWMGRIRRVCRSEETLREIAEHPLKPEQKENRILYLVMKRPNPAFLLGLKILLKLYDGRKR